MNLRRLRLFSALVVAACLAASTLAGTVLAGNPAGWHATTASIPKKVTPGEPVRYHVEFWNEGPSNISKLFLSAITPGDGVLLVLQHPDGVTCDAPPVLHCDLGAVPADATHHYLFDLVYQTATNTGSAFEPIFEFNTTGIPSGRNKSHGDALKTSDPTTLSSSSDFHGRYAYNSDLLVVFDNEDLGRGNKQSTRVNGPTANIPITVGEGPLSSVDCPSEVPNGSCFSEWSDLNVGAGTNYPAGFTVVLGLSKFELTGGKNAGNVGFVHILDNGTVDLLERCSQTVTTNCFTAVGSNGNIIATLNLTDNGKVGGY